MTRRQRVFVTFMAFVYVSYAVSIGLLATR